MPNIRCNQCGETVSSVVSACPYCGYAVARNWECDRIHNLITRNLPVTRESVFKVLGMFKFNMLSLPSLTGRDRPSPASPTFLIINDFFDDLAQKYRRNEISLGEINAVLETPDKVLATLTEFSRGYPSWKQAQRTAQRRGLRRRWYSTALPGGKSL